MARPKTRLFLIAVAALLALLASQWLLQGLRLDLTADQRYTLSPATRRILARLPESVTLEFYFSNQLTRDMPLLRNYAQRVRELLTEYQRVGNGKLRLEVIDPEPFSEQEDLAVQRGLRSVALAPGAPEIYFGLAAISSSGKRAIIPFFDEDREPYLEYDISALLVEASRDHKPKLALYAEPDLLARGGINPFNQKPQDPWVVVEQIAGFYDVTWLAEDFTKLPDTTELLVLIHPKELTDTSLYAIDQFIMGGGSALIFVDSYAEQDGPPAFVQPGRNKSSDLNRLFNAWGFRQVPARFVGDNRFATPVKVAESRPATRHLGLLTLTKDAFADNPIVAHLDKLVASSAGALQPQANGFTGKFLPLLLSSEESMLIPTAALDYLFDPGILYDAFKPQGQRYPMAALIEGEFPSAFPLPPANADPSRHLASAVKASRMLVVTDTDLLSDRLWVRTQKNPDGQRGIAPFAENGSFVINAIDHLTGNPDLVAIRSRGILDRRFEKVETLRRQTEASLRKKAAELQEKLEATEKRMAQLESQTKDTPNGLTAEQQRTLEAFQQQRLAIRKDLRRLQHQLNEEIERLGNRIKWINILLVPLLLTLLALAAKASQWRRGNRVHQNRPTSK